MTTELFIELRFAGGRYHATPWGRQVNEGAVEWPPSPWRLLRTLISVWHATAREEVSESVLRRLVEQLAATAPSWRLPEVTQAHTRHYMPTRDSSTKIFDNFLVVDRDAVAIGRWSGLELDAALLEALDRLLGRVNYLGRSESWVELRRIDPPAEFVPNAGPAAEFETAEGLERVRQLVPLAGARLEDWRVGYRDAMQARKLDEKRRNAVAKGKDPDREKLSKKELEAIEAALPASVYDVLVCETDALQKAGWSQPPGSCWIDYLAPRPAPWVAPRIASSARGELPTVARFAVASDVPPRLTTAIHQTQKLHQSLVRYSDGHPLFTGLGADGKPLEGHRHAFIFAEANDGRTDRITHLSVWVPGGLDERQRLALDLARRLWGKDGHDMQLVLLGVGQREDFAGFNAAAGQCALMEASTRWRSLTPFISTRHPKRRKNGEFKLDAQGLVIDGPEHVLRRLLAEQELPDVVSITPLEGAHIHGRTVHWLEFDTLRGVRDSGRSGGARGPKSGQGFEIVFAEPVRGPLAAGYGAHFGMGLFVPVDPTVSGSST